MRYPTLGRALLACALIPVVISGCAGSPGLETEAVAEVDGRRVAPRSTMADAPAWVRPTRETEERSDELFRGLNVVPGMTACEVGAGNGFYTLELARLVYPGGKVIAVDILPAMLEALAAQESEARRQGDQMVPIQRVGGQPDDPALPEAGCDMILLAHAYVEFDRPRAMLDSINRAMAPDGRLVVIEYRAEDPPPKVDRVRTMTKSRMHKEISGSGFRLIGQIDSLPRQHLLLYGTRDTPRVGVQLRPWRKKFSEVEDDGLQAPPPTPPEQWDGELE